MNRTELMQWWNETPRERRKFVRLSPRGAVASELAFRKGDLAAVRASFEAQSPRLEARYPAFLRDVRALLVVLEADAELEVEQVVLAQVVAELEA